MRVISAQLMAEENADELDQLAREACSPRKWNPFASSALESLEVRHENIIEVRIWVILGECEVMAVLDKFCPSRAQTDLCSIALVLGQAVHLSTTQAGRREKQFQYDLHDIL